MAIGINKTVRSFFRPPKLLLLAVFLLGNTALPKQAFAATTWQHLSSPNTNIAAFAQMNSTVFGSTDQYIFERQTENGAYTITPTSTTKVFSNNGFLTKSLAADGNTLYAVVYISSNFGSLGVYKSLDSGASWQPTAPVGNPRVLAAYKGTVLVGTTNSLAISTDNGATWQKKLTTPQEFTDIAVSDNLFLASTTTQLYASYDSGLSWSTLSLPQANTFHIAIQGTTILAGGQFTGLLRSTDSGVTWQTQFLANNTQEHPVGPFVFADTSLVYGAGYHKVNGTMTGTVFSSTDGGATWAIVDTGITHAVPYTQRVNALTLQGTKLYMALQQDGVFSYDIGSPFFPVKKTPVILIPGIGGSEFKASSNITHNEDNGHGGIFNRVYSTGELLWLNIGEALKPGNDDYFDVLRMQANGTAPLHSEVVLNGSVVNSAYGDFIKFFTNHGYVLNKDLFIYPYDWRKDITLSADLLDPTIEAIRKQTGSAKVDLVGHSMGGLVARKYIDAPTHAAKVRKLITLGAPFLGSVDAIKALHYGNCLSKFNSSAYCLGVSPTEVSDVVQNALGNFELMPSSTYYSFYDNSDSAHPFPIRDDRDMDNNNIFGSLNYTQSKDLLKNLGHNSKLFTSSEIFHSIDTRLKDQDSVQTYTIVGSGQCTLGRIREYTKTNFLNNSVTKREMGLINGDGTVPLYSASLIDVSKDINLAGSTKVVYSNLDHGRLAASGSALNETYNILNELDIPATGISNTPYKAKCKQISVLSPVTIDVYDSQGNHTGKTAKGDFETNIPGSSYDELDEGKSVILPNDGVYTVKLQALSKGFFDLKINSIENDENTRTTLYADIPLDTLTKGQFTYDTTQDTPPTIQIDQNGDGSSIQPIKPTADTTGIASTDITPPETQIKISGDQGYANWYKSDVTVTFETTDNASGVAKTEYSLDGGRTIQQYSGPITLSQEGTNTILFRSTDNAGNQETLQTKEIDIDKTPPEATISYDLENEEFTINGIDNLGSTSSNINGTIAVLQDPAGNTTTLTFSTTSDDQQQRLTVKSIQYNSEDHQFDGNRFSVAVNNNKSSYKLRSFRQKIIIAKDEKVRSTYKATQDNTVIVSKTSDNKKQMTKSSGITLLKLVTDRGNLNFVF